MTGRVVWIFLFPLITNADENWRLFFFDLLIILRNEPSKGDAKYTHIDPNTNIYI